MRKKITGQELLYAAIDTWLPLHDEKEKKQFERLLSQLSPEEQKNILELMAQCEASRPLWTGHLSGGGDATPPPDDEAL